MLESMKTFFSSFIPNPREVEFAGEDEGEKIILLMRRHFVTNLPWILALGVMLFVPVFLPLILEFGGISVGEILPLRYILVLSLLWYLVTAVYAFESYLSWYFNVYIVTD
ncbi:hypothetical protein HY419_01650, partial [candidate division WWE3 bacterium]|nr:hypothetical protein [candidate division WWE3 bacterium]